MTLFTGTLLHHLNWFLTRKHRTVADADVKPPPLVSAEDNLSIHNVHWTMTQSRTLRGASLLANRELIELQAVFFVYGYQKNLTSDELIAYTFRGDYWPLRDVPMLNKTRVIRERGPEYIANVGRKLVGLELPKQIVYGLGASLVESSPGIQYTWHVNRASRFDALRRWHEVMQSRLAK